MLCSICNKNVAVIFINKIEGNKKSVEGLCYNCAKDKGLNPLDILAKQANLSDNDIKDMSKQFENIFTDMSDELMNDEKFQKGEGLSLGAFMSNLFGEKDSTSSQEEEDINSNKKKIKIDKKPKEKKKKFLDTYGTNLTEKARQNLLDIVVGRDREIQRVIQILNRRSKNNPCLIGEPGVGKTAIAQGLAIKIAEKQVPAKLCWIHRVTSRSRGQTPSSRDRAWPPGPWLQAPSTFTDAQGTRAPPASKVG